MPEPPIIENIDHPVIILDLDKGCFVDFNTKAHDFFGLSKKELLAKNPLSVSPPFVYGHETVKFLDHVLGEALKGENLVFDWIHLDNKGQEVPCEVRLMRHHPFTKNFVRGTIIDKRKKESVGFLLRESEERLRISLQATKVGTYDWFPQKDQLHWDQRLYEIFELDKDQSIDFDQHFFSVIHPDDKERVTDEFNNTLKDNGVSLERIEYRIIIHQQIKYILGYSKIIRNEEGKVVRMIGTVQDISPLRISEEELKKSQQFLKSVVNDQEEMIVRWKPGGIRTFVNKAYCEAFGLDREEAIGKSFFPLLETSFKKIFNKVIKSLTKEHPTRVYSSEVTLPNGRLVWQEWRERAFFDRDGKVTEYQSVGRDITEQKLARLEIDRMSERLRTISDNLPGVVFQYKMKADMTDQLLYVSDGSNDLWGIRPEDAIMDNSRVWSGVHPDDVDYVRKTLLRSFETLEKWYGEWRHILPNGKIKWNVGVGQPKKQEDGSVLLDAMATDQSDRKIAESKLSDSERKLSLIYNTSSDFILLIRVEKLGYFIESINEATILGLRNAQIDVEKEDIIDLNMRDYFKNILYYSEDQIKEQFARYQQVKKTKKSIQHSTEAEYNGIFFATKTTSTPIIESGEVRFILTVSHDVTALVNSRRELETAYVQVNELKAQLEQENVYLKEEIRQANDFEDMVFSSQEFRSVLDQVEQVASTTATVLVTGETGTGKELIARAIHNTSERKDKSLIKVNTAAIPRDLIESELFGYEKGAFTGAINDKAGKFELADGGSIFLDEIGDMSLDLQVKILRILQEGEVERLGSDKLKKIDVRIIAATNKDLKKAVSEGTFRQDLYFRLNVFPIEIPPLRSRAGDIPILVEHFISKYSIKHGKSVKTIPKGTMNYLRSYSWPGNVRELENTIERAMILSKDDKLYIKEANMEAGSEEEWSHDDSLEIVQQNHIRKILNSCNWKIEGKNGAAAKLKIKPSTLRDKMKRFDIKRTK